MIHVFHLFVHRGPKITKLTIYFGSSQLVHDYNFFEFIKESLYMFSFHSEISDIDLYIPVVASILFPNHALWVMFTR